MDNSSYATLSCSDRYTKFKYKDTTITFMHGKDLIKYDSVVKWDAGYLVVNCTGREKKSYEDYIDLSYILENLYMDPNVFLEGVKEVRIEDA